jgi:hypothetical protein
VDVCKVCIDESLSFHLIKFRRDTVDLISAEVQMKHRVVQGVRRPIEALDFINPEGRLKDHFCKECIGCKTQITKSYLKVCRKECEHGSF